MNVFAQVVVLVCFLSTKQNEISGKRQGLAPGDRARLCPPYFVKLHQPRLGPKMADALSVCIGTSPPGMRTMVGWHW